MAITFAVRHFFGIKFVCMILVKSCVNQVRAQGPRFFMNSGKMLSYPAAFPHLRPCRTFSSSAASKGSVSISSAGVFWCFFSSVISALLVSLSWGALAMVSKWDATWLGVTDARLWLGGFCAAPRRRMRLQHFLLEWVKLRSAAVSSHFFHRAELSDSMRRSAVSVSPDVW